MTDKQPALFDWATELSDAQGHVTLAEQEAHEIGARLRSMHAELETLRAGYDASRLEIESLRKEHADELTVAYMCGASREKELAAQQPSPSAASKAVLAAIRAANMQLVRTGDDAFMLVTYKQATPQADSVLEDAARYRWLRERMLGIDFDWNESGITALSFEMPDGCAYGGCCNQNIDAARAAQEGKSHDN